VLSGYKPKLLKISKSIDTFDTLFIGTPVWAGTCAPAVKSFLSKNNIKGKKIALFCTHRGEKGLTFEKMKKLLKESQIIGEKGFCNVHKEPEKAKKKAEEWLSELSL